MRGGQKRSTSRRAANAPRQARGRKGQDEMEKLLTGAGWTLAATTHFLQCATDEERFAHVLAMFSVAEDDYKYKPRSSFQIDFHVSNGLFCLEKEYDASNTQFVCRSLTTLLEVVLTHAQNDQVEPKFEELREQLLEEFQNGFFEYNAEEYKFDPQQTKCIVSYVGTALIQPIRLIYQAHRVESRVAQLPYPRKIWAPSPPDPLCECMENIPLPPPEAQFVAPIVPRGDALMLADIRDTVAQYTDSVIGAIDKRYDRMEEMLQKLGTLG